MNLPGVWQSFVASQAVIDSGNLNPLRFTSQRDSNRLSLFISLSGGATASIQPVFRRVRQSNEQPLTISDDLQLQYESDDQRITLTAAGNYYRQVAVPRGMEVAIRVQAIVGGATISVLGDFEPAF